MLSSTTLSTLHTTRLPKLHFFHPFPLRLSSSAIQRSFAACFFSSPPSFRYPLYSSYSKKRTCNSFFLAHARVRATLCHSTVHDDDLGFLKENRVCPVSARLVTHRAFFSLFPLPSQTPSPWQTAREGKKRAWEYFGQQVRNRKSKGRKGPCCDPCPPPFLSVWSFFWGGGEYGTCSTMQDRYGTRTIVFSSGLFFCPRFGLVFVASWAGVGVALGCDSGVERKGPPCPAWLWITHLSRPTDHARTLRNDDETNTAVVALGSTLVVQYKCVQDNQTP